MSEYKAEIEMQGVRLKPIYRKKKFSVINTAKIEIMKAQKLHPSYNVPAIVHVFVSDNGDWTLDEKVQIGVYKYE